MCSKLVVSTLGQPRFEVKEEGRTRSESGERVVEVLHPVVQVRVAGTDRANVRFEVSEVDAAMRLAKRSE